MSKKRTYICIDLKSFYASSECVDRGLDPLTTNLVVADLSRTEKTICLAVSPSLKGYGISGRARLFEVITQVKRVNEARLQKAIRMKKVAKDENGKYAFAGSSFDDLAIQADPSLELSYIIAPPHMARYMEVSAQIYSIYLKFVSPEDILAYSIDEVFMDITGYLNTYGMTAQELVKTMIREVLYATGITATAGIGTNLYGRMVPKPAHGSIKLQAATNLGSKILPAVTELFDRIADKKLLVRRLTICAGRLTPDDGCQQIDMFSDEEAEEREKKLQDAVISIKKRYGKNAILRGISYEESATMRDRNGYIGGHKA